MKHINITNWQGNITDWTKFNYIYGGLDDTLADRVNLRIPGTNLRNYFRKSNNLVHFEDREGTSQGFAYSYKNGVITISGTARSSGNIFLPYLENVATVTTGVHRLTLFINTPDSSIKLFVGHYQGAYDEEPTFRGVSCDNTKVTVSKNFTVGGTMNIMPYITAIQGTTYNITIRPMITVGEEIPTTYEPYGSMVLVENVGSNLQPLDPPKIMIFNQVDLGTLNWSGGQVGWYQTYFPQIQVPANNDSKANISAPGYTSKSSNDVFSPTRGDMGIGVNVNNHYLQLRNNATSSIAEIKALLKGVIMLYESASQPSANTLSMASPMHLDNTNVEEDIEYLEDTKFNEEILSEEE